MPTINMADEQLLTLKQAASRLPRDGERKVHVATLNRWVNHGIRGVRLEVIRVGGMTYTSAEALQRFADRLSTPTPQPASPASMTKRQEHTEKALKEAGW